MHLTVERMTNPCLELTLVASDEATIFNFLTDNFDVHVC